MTYIPYRYGQIQGSNPPKIIHYYVPDYSGYITNCELKLYKGDFFVNTLASLLSIPSTRPLSLPHQLLVFILPPERVPHKPNIETTDWLRGGERSSVLVLGKLP